jgi:hypothetical protein
MMTTGKSTLISIAFVAGAIVSATVTAFVPDSHWKGLQWMFVLPSGLVAERLFGVEFASAHRVFTYGLAAVLNGLLLALLLFLISLFLPRLTRRGMGLALALFVIIDVILLVLVSPLRELP